MKIHFALFDPSYLTIDGAYWTWRSSGFDMKLLNKLYYEVAGLDRPEDPNRLASSTILGGFAAIGEDLVFAYRFGNGGYDSFGRPGRFIMVVAGLRLDQTEPCDLEGIVSGPVFSNALANAQQSCPTPEPPDLEIDLSLPPARVDPMLISTVLREKRLSLPGSEDLTGKEILSLASGICMSLPAGRRWQCKFRIEGEAGMALVEYADSPSKILPKNSEWIAESGQRYRSNVMTTSTTKASRFLWHVSRRQLLFIVVSTILAFIIAETWRLLRCGFFSP